MQTAVDVGDDRSGPFHLGVVDGNDDDWSRAAFAGSSPCRTFR